MIIKKITVLLVESIIFFITAVLCLMIFFYVKDEFAQDTSSPNLYGAISAIIALIIIFISYSYISKKLEK
ncbi:hypothetical protein [Nitrincola sp.]|uniref:hypothetical protein n=1 Tax=Nitrincola sp. TaxID=1926584 RepID=UPI003A8DD584